MLRYLLIVLSLIPVLRADIQSVMSESNLEKRSQLALEQAKKDLEAAREAYSEDKMDDFRRLVNEVGDLAELSYKSLQDTGKKARRSPKWFKRAELKLRTLLRYVDDLERDVSYDDRPAVESVHKRMQAVHQQILHDIMTKK